jgi:hypothetical protein
VRRAQAKRAIDVEKITLSRAHGVPNSGRKATIVGRVEVQNKVYSVEEKFEGAGKGRKTLKGAVVLL